MYVAVTGICFLNKYDHMPQPLFGRCIDVLQEFLHAQTFFFFLGPPKKELRLFMPLVLTLASFFSP